MMYFVGSLKNIMKKISSIILLFIICACSVNNKKNDNDIERIPVDLKNIAIDASSFIDKIEIVPLETNDSSLIGNYKKMMYDKDKDIYVVYDRRQIVYTFSGEGSFIANSRKMKGKGPQEYYMVLDVKFNPFLNGIDFLNPYGVIYTYSIDFKLISKRKVNSKIVLNSLMALDANNYIFTYPSVWTDQEVLFANLETQEMHDASYDGTISSRNTMDKECFYRDGEQYYFVPNGINYYFYRIDDKEMKLVPIMYLDFGEFEIKEEDLPGRASGKRSDSDQDISEYSKQIGERYFFLRESNYTIPIVKYFNDNFVYIFFTKNNSNPGSFIFDRKKRKGYLLKDDKPFRMQYCFAISDNVLLAICEPGQLSEFIISDLMSPKEIQKMEQLKEDDNPVIIKYYLKK